MEKLDMSLDDIIKFNKKVRKQNVQNQQNAKKKKKPVAVIPQNRLRQFRGKPGTKAKQGTYRNNAANRSQQKNNKPFGTSPLNRQQGAMRKQTAGWQNPGAGNQVTKRMGQRKRQSLKRQQAAQMGSTQQLQKAGQGRRTAQQAQLQARQKALNLRRKLPQLSPNQKQNRNVGGLRSDLILQQQLQQQQQRKQQMLVKRQNKQQKRRWGRTNATETNADNAIFTISVANVKTDNDVKVILQKPRIRRKPGAAPQNQQPLQQMVRQNSDVQVVIANQQQRKRPRLRRNKKQGNQIQPQPPQTSSEPQQQWPSLAEQIKLMQPTVSTKFTFNRVDFGQDQTGVSLTERFSSTTTKQSPVSQTPAGRVVMF